MIKTVRILAVFCLIAMFSVQIKGQYYENQKKKSSIGERFFFGGGLGLSFGQVTYIEIAPLIGYKVTERFQPGIGLSYSYYNDNRYSVPFEYSTYAGSVFLRYYIIRGLFAHAEFEALNAEIFTLTSSITYTSRREWIDSYLVGGGYFKKLGDRSGIYIVVLWNLNQTELTPYSNPVMKIGFNF